MVKVRFRRLLDGMGEPATIIGQHLRFEGQLSGDGHVLVSGTVEGDSQLDGSVTIGATGRWIGALKAADIVIAGTVEGDVEARGRAEIQPTAIIEGSISGAQISIGEGARVDGKLTTTTDDEIQQFAEKRQTTEDASRS